MDGADRSGNYIRGDGLMSKDQTDRETVEDSLYLSARVAISPSLGLFRLRVGTDVDVIVVAGLGDTGRGHLGICH
jgi:hypothetical protein